MIKVLRGKSSHQVIRNAHLTQDPQRPSTGMNFMKNRVCGNYAGYEPKINSSDRRRPSTSFSGTRMSTNFESIHLKNIQKFKGTSFKAKSKKTTLR